MDLMKDWTWSFKTTTLTEVFKTRFKWVRLDALPGEAINRDTGIRSDLAPISLRQRGNSRLPCPSYLTFQSCIRSF